MDKKLKGKPGESRRRKATELPRHRGRNVSGAARFDGWDFPVCSPPIWRKRMVSKNKPAQFDNRLYYGDNLDVLRNKIHDETVDLCYIDPPFNSKRNYFQIYNNIGGEADRAQAQAFMDTWEWGDEAEDGLSYITNVANLNNGRFTPQTVALIQGLINVLGKGDLMAYLVHMTQRIVEIHRVLKPTGSFYLHCDPTASHYLKLVCDGVFCGSGRSGDFQNEIIWAYDSAGRSKNTSIESMTLSFGSQNQKQNGSLTEQQKAWACQETPKTT